MIKSLLLAVAITATLPTAVSATEFSDKNHPEYWGASCRKIENVPDLRSYDASEGATLVIVKGGTEHKVYEVGPFVDLTAAINERSGKPYDISHVIECFDESTDDNGDVCEYDETLSVEDENCHPDDTDDNDGTGGDTPSDVDGEVLGDDQPTILPVTGASAWYFAIAGVTAGVIAWSVQRVREIRSLARKDQ
jgi:hypothetical protein